MCRGGEGESKRRGSSTISGAGLSKREGQGTDSETGPEKSWEVSEALDSEEVGRENEDTGEMRKRLLQRFPHDGGSLAHGAVPQGGSTSQISG